MVNTSLKNIDFLIQNKDQINDRELEAIYNLSVRYPYSSFCHFFLYSVLKKQNRTGVENVLKKTAIRFHDRSLLKKLSENSMVKQNTKEKIDVTNIDEIIQSALATELKPIEWSKEDIEALEPGTTYITPNGTINTR